MIYIIISVSAAALGVVLYLALRVRRVVQMNQNDIWLADEFRRCNVTVDGPQGSGKDLIFAHVIHLRNEPHYANIPYNFNTEERPLTDLNTGTNTFEKLAANDIDQFEPVFEEGRDFYISDAGIALPAHYRELLQKLYPTMPIFIALARQLHNMRVHNNSQYFKRVWDKFREQSDSFIRCRGKAKDMGEYLLVKTTCYEMPEAFESNLLPSPLLSARYGAVVSRIFKVYKYELEYDTRAFREKLLKQAAQTFGEVLDCLENPLDNLENPLSNIGEL